jgi:hypothetical protein
MTGGNITMAGNEIKLAAAQLDASGMDGGGTIHVGGLMHGAAGFSAQGIALNNAANVLVNSATMLKADALQTGNGGEVVLWSDQAMRFTGSISAKGGALSGNGGNAEVSGRVGRRIGRLSGGNGRQAHPRGAARMAGKPLPAVDPFNRHRRRRRLVVGGRFWCRGGRGRLLRRRGPACRQRKQQHCDQALPPKACLNRP